MSNYRFDETQIASRLGQLDHRSRVAFALSCVERMLPNYRAFQREHHWGDVETILRGIECGWAWVQGTKNADINLVDIAVTCEEQAPDTEDFQSRYVSPALDAATATAALMELIRTADVAKAVEVASLSRDTVDMFVQEIESMPANSPDIEERIRLHPLMQAELERQNRDLDLLEAGANIDDLAAKWRSPAVSNIGLS